MPGISCSAYDPADTAVEPKWRRGLELLRHQPEHVLEHYNEPGFHLACIYHPEVCQRQRILVTEHFVLACHGNIYERRWAHLTGGEALCRALLGYFHEFGANTLKNLNGRYDIVPNSFTGNAATLQPSRKASSTISRPSRRFWTGTSLISAHAFRSIFSMTSCSTNA